MRLVAAGHEAMHLHDALTPEAKDLDVAFEANRLEAILVSKDEDFADLSRRGILTVPFLWVRSGNVTNARLWQMLEPLLPESSQPLRLGKRLLRSGELAAADHGKLLGVDAESPQIAGARHPSGLDCLRHGNGAAEGVEEAADSGESIAGVHSRAFHCAMHHHL